MASHFSIRVSLIQTWTWVIGAAALLMPLLLWWQASDPEQEAWSKAHAELSRHRRALQATAFNTREELLSGSAALEPLFLSKLDKDGNYLNPPQWPKPIALEKFKDRTPASSWYDEGIRRVSSPQSAIEAFDQAKTMAAPEESGLLLRIDLAKVQALQRLGQHQEAADLLYSHWRTVEDSWTLHENPVGLLIGHRLSDTLEELGMRGEALTIRNDLHWQLLYGDWPLTEEEILLELTFLQPINDGIRQPLPAADQQAQRAIRRRTALRMLPDSPTAPGTLILGDALLLVNRRSDQAAMYWMDEMHQYLLEELQQELPRNSPFALSASDKTLQEPEWPNATIDTSAMLIPGWQLHLVDFEHFAAPLRNASLHRLLSGGGLGFTLLALMFFGRRLLLREADLQRSRTEFLAGVSHELRTPAASLSLLADNLVHGRVSGEERKQEYYRSMLRDARRLERLVVDVLDVTRMDRGSFTIERKPCDLRPMLLELVEEQAPRLADAQITLECHVENPLPTLNLDVFAIERACANLLENARRYASQGQWAELRAESSASGGIIIRVTDRGPGVPEEWQEQIFHSFERLPQDQNLAAGAGLGLALVRAVLLAHGGTVHVEQGPANLGASFVMEFPKDA